MKSVGEAMALGRNFTEALQKAMRSLEQKGASFSFKPLALSEAELAELIEKTRFRPLSVFPGSAGSAGWCYRGAAARATKD